MTDLVTIDQDGHVLLIGVNRPDKANAWNRQVIREVCEAYGTLRDDRELRVGVVYGHGDHFTAGLDLADVLPAVAENPEDPGIMPAGLPDPWNFLGEPCPKPIVVAAHGRCNTLGIELMLASAVAVAAPDTLFAQLEVARGIFPLGGGAHRLPAQLGKQGLRWLLTAETFDATDALAAGLLTEIAEPERHLERASELAHQIAANAPLGVQGALASAQAAERVARDAAADAIRSRIAALATSADAAEGMAAMLERRDPVWQGE